MGDFPGSVQAFNTSVENLRDEDQLMSMNLGKFVQGIPYARLESLDPAFLKRISKLSKHPCQ